MLKSLKRLPPTGNPYADARDEWDDRYDRLTASRHNWQLLAFALLVLDGLLAGGLFYLASTSRITPYVVEVDRHGHAVAFGPAERLADPDERIWRYELATFIRDLRTVYAPGSEGAAKQALNKAYSHLRGSRATSRVGTWFTDHNPFAADRGSVAVEVTSVLRLETNIWQVQWTETHLGRDGGRLRLEPWQAVLTVTVDPPDTSERILLNPLGVYIVDLDWNPIPTKEIR